MLTFFAYYYVWIGIALLFIDTKREIDKGARAEEIPDRMFFGYIIAWPIFLKVGDE